MKNLLFIGNEVSSEQLGLKNLGETLLVVSILFLCGAIVLYAIIKLFILLKKDE